MLVLEWVAFSFLIVFAVAVYGTSFCFVKEFWELRKSKPILTRIPELTVSLFAFALIPITEGLITILCTLLSMKVNKALSVLIVGFWVLLAETTIIARVWHFNWQYTLMRYDMEQVWKSELQLQHSKSWAVRFTWLFSSWRRTLSAVLFTAVLFFAIVAVALVYTHDIVKFITDASIGLIVVFVILMTTALYQTTDCRDIYGIRDELKLIGYILAIWLAVGLLVHWTTAAFSIWFRLWMNFRTTAAVGVMMFVSTRLQIVRNTHFFTLDDNFRMPPKPIMRLKSSSCSHSYKSQSRTRTSSKKSFNEYWRRCLEEYTAFGLFAEHCISEMSAENLLFIVAYMRLKEFLFRHLNAEDLFEFDSGETPAAGGMLLQDVLRPTSPSLLPRASSGSHLPRLSSLSPELPDFVLIRKGSHYDVSPTVDENYLADGNEDDGDGDDDDARGAEQESEGDEFGDEFSPRQCYHYCDLGKMVKLPSEVLEMKETAPGLGDCVTKLVEVFDNYGDFDAMRSVNVSGMAREHAFGCIGSVYFAKSASEKRRLLLDCIPPMDGILNEVLRILKGDAFIRFMHSPVFNNWLDTVRPPASV